MDITPYNRYYCRMPPPTYSCCKPHSLLPIGGKRITTKIKINGNSDFDIYGKSNIKGVIFNNEGNISKSDSGRKR